MKKISLVTMVLAVACLFAACTKEGAFNPKEKISKVYKSSTSAYTYAGVTTTNETAKYLNQLWNWDGKTVTSINRYNSDGNLTYTINFTYDGKQLTRMQEAGSENYTEFVYDGSTLTKYNTYYGTTLEQSATVTHDGKKIVQIDVVNYDNDKAKSPRYMEYMQTLMQVVMPVYTEKTEQMLSTVAAKGNSTYTVKFEWDGKNVSKITETGNDGDGYTIEYTYDEMKNPYQGFLYALAEEAAAFGSKNNVTSEKYTSTYTYLGQTLTETETVNYTYEYDGKWPITRTNTRSESESSYSYTYTAVVYYEYAD